MQFTCCLSDTIPRWQPSFSTGTTEPMTNEQINAAIAETCGWTEIQEGDPWGTLIGKPNRRTYRDPWHGTEDLFEIPDYCNDLNAMQASVLLSRCNLDLSYLYINNLCKACGVNHQYLCVAIIHATARQRAEAFLRTIGKWDGAN
jgi:hypothetical protein